MVSEEIPFVGFCIEKSFFKIMFGIRGEKSFGRIEFDSGLDVLGVMCI